jgi:integrase
MAAKKAKIQNVKFHDTRHTAATRLAQKIGVLDLCRMFGWRDPRHAMVYYNPAASDIAKRLENG